MIAPCGTCLRAEFADDDYEGSETLYLRPGGETHPALPRTGHLKRPSGSEGTGDGLTQAIRSARGVQTYCGIPMMPGWKEVPR